MENIINEKKEKLDLIKNKINKYEKEDSSRFTQIKAIVNAKNELVVEKEPKQLQLELEL